MGSRKRFFLIEGFYFNGICTFDFSGFSLNYQLSNRIFSTLIPSGVRMVLSFENTNKIFFFFFGFLHI